MHRSFAETWQSTECYEETLAPFLSGLRLYEFLGRLVVHSRIKTGIDEVFGNLVIHVVILKEHVFAGEDMRIRS